MVISFTKILNHLVTSICISIGGNIMHCKQTIFGYLPRGYHIKLRFEIY